MEVSFAKLSFLLFVCGLLLASGYATPIGNHWHATDPRCFGGPASSYRLRRSVTTNNKSGGIQNYWKYNGNSGSCDRAYGNPLEDRSSFDSEGECDKACRNVYRF